MVDAVDTAVSNLYKLGDDGGKRRRASDEDSSSGWSCNEEALRRVLENVDVVLGNARWASCVVEQLNKYLEDVPASLAHLDGFGQMALQVLGRCRAGRNLSSTAGYGIMTILRHCTRTLSHASDDVHAVGVALLNLLTTSFRLLAWTFQAASTKVEKRSAWFDPTFFELVSMVVRIVRATSGDSSAAVVDAAVALQKATQCCLFVGVARLQCPLKMAPLTLATLALDLSTACSSEGVLKLLVGVLDGLMQTTTAGDDLLRTSFLVSWLKQVADGTAVHDALELVHTLFKCTKDPRHWGLVTDKDLFKTVMETAAQRGDQASKVVAIDMFEFVWESAQAAYGSTGASRDVRLQTSRHAANVLARMVRAVVDSGLLALLVEDFVAYAREDVPTPLQKAAAKMFKMLVFCDSDQVHAPSMADLVLTNSLVAAMLRMHGRALSDCDSTLCQCIMMFVTHVVTLRLALVEAVIDDLAFMTWIRSTASDAKSSLDRMQCGALWERLKRSPVFVEGVVSRWQSVRHDAAGVCPICLDAGSAEDVARAKVLTPCGHPFHMACIREWVQVTKCPTCPSCRGVLKL